jgi:serine/threonine-protein kinase RsbW
LGTRARDMSDQKSVEARTVDMTLESTLDSVDSAEETVLREATEVGFDEDDLHRIGMSIRECMVNAVVHGNQYDSRKKVHLKVSRKQDQIEILIGDEGGHFDHSKVPDPLADDNLLRQSGRGLLLMRAFMDEFEVRQRTPAGTEVRLVKHLAKA